MDLESEVAQTPAVNSDSIYTYSCITEGTIRLIKLQPSKDIGTPIECSIIEKLLRTCEDEIVDHYTALSYVWGDPARARCISMDGKLLSITISLDCALRHIRDKTRALFIWADGICINQADVEDRHVQVRQMEAIYSTAHHTIIFLGDLGPEADLLIEFLASRPPAEISSIHSDIDDIESRFQSLFKGHCHSRGWTAPLYILQSLLHQHILCQPWFSRVWILQEVVLSADPWIQCGRHRLRWDRFCEHILHLPFEGMFRNHIASINGIRSEHKLRIEKPQTLQEASTHMLSILVKRRGLGVSDPRDMIYGHLGLCSPRIRSDVTISYSKSISAVYQEITAMIVEGGYPGNLSILSYVEQLRPNDRQHHLPSWVPNWNVEYEVDNSRTYLYPIGDEAMASEAQVLDNSSTLVVSGECYGTIKQILHPLDEIWKQQAQERTEKNIDFVLRCLYCPESEDMFRQVKNWFRELCEDSLDAIVSSHLPTTETSPEQLETLLPLVLGIFSRSKNIRADDKSAQPGLVPKLVYLLEDMMWCLQGCLLLHQTTAILHTGQIMVLWSSLARIGDKVCSVDGYSNSFIFQPEGDQNARRKKQAVQLSQDQEAAEMKDWYGYGQESLGSMERKVETVKFVI